MGRCREMRPQWLKQMRVQCAYSSGSGEIEGVKGSVCHASGLGLCVHLLSQCKFRSLLGGARPVWNQGDGTV